MERSSSRETGNYSIRYIFIVLEPVQAYELDTGTVTASSNTRGSGGVSRKKKNCINILALISCIRSNQADVFFFFKFLYVSHVGG